MALRSIWTYITNIGIDEAALGREVIKVRLLNQLIFLALFTSLLALSTYIIFFDGYTIIFTTLANIALESFGIFLAFQRKHITARVLAVFAFPTLIANHVLILGGNFGEANIFTAIGLMSFILYEGQRRIQITAIVYISFLFVASKLYTIQRVYEAQFEKNPYDEIVTFPMVLIILGLILFLYQREMKRYEEQKSNLIKDLEGKNEALFQLNNELEQFTYIASHDLKTPLRTISSYLDLIPLHLKKQDTEGLDRDIQFAKKGASQMYALINDILEYKRISQLEPKQDKIDLNAIFEEVKHNLNHLIQEKKGVLISDKLPIIKGNKSDYIALFQNLIENGLKYNQSEQPIVSIYAKKKGNSLHLFFEDNGIGIAPEYHDRIFKFFNRLHTPEEYEGTGIGLGLCKKIMSKYKGDILVVSNLGEGAVFQLSFPDDLL